MFSPPQLGTDNFVCLCFVWVWEGDTTVRPQELYYFLQLINGYDDGYLAHSTLYMFLLSV
jgi:hypothetical protein